jgi:amidase
MRPLLLFLLAMPAAAQTPTESVRAALARIEALEPKVNAIIAVEPGALDEARALERGRRAQGPLHGLPLVIKDNIETRGPLPTTAGSAVLALNVSGRDAPVVARLRAAGAIPVAKANLSEWANFRSSFSSSGWSTVGGQTRNPHALDRNPCGSSSGSAAAVAAGMVTAAVGTETDGSIVCPASVTGIVGLKPTLGLVSRTGIVPIAESQDTAGPMTADVPTAARLLSVMAGTDPADPATAEADARRVDYLAALVPGALKGARIGVLPLETGSEGVKPLFEATLALLEREGAILVRIEKMPDRTGLGAAEFEVLKSEFRSGLDAYLARTPNGVTARSLEAVIAANRANPAALAQFGQDLLEASLAAPKAGSPEHQAAREKSLKIATEVLETLLSEHKVEALVAPTTPLAWKIDSINGDTPPSFPGASTLAAVAGTPHLTVPMGLARGLPAGLSFLGPKWSDARMLALGAAFEAARGPLPTAALAISLD